MGSLMGGMFKANLNKAIPTIIQDLTIYAETGEISDTKKKRKWILNFYKEFYQPSVLVKNPELLNNPSSIANNENFFDVYSMSKEDVDKAYEDLQQASFALAQKLYQSQQAEASSTADSSEEIIDAEVVNN